VGASSTLTQIRQFVGQEMGGQGLGGFLASTATSGSSTTLVDTTWPVKTTLVVDEQWKDAWIFRPAAVAADKVRIVDTYTPSTGTFTVDNPYGVAPVAAEAYEIHTVIEPLTAMLNIINEGLKRCMIETEIAATPVALDQVHCVTTIAPWLEKKSWVRQVGYLGVNDNRAQISPYTRVVRGEAYEADGVVYLDHPGRAFLATDVLYIRAMKPAYAAVTNAAGTAQSTGFVLETDKCPVNLEWAGWAAVIEGWRRYGQILETGAKTRLIPTRAEAAAMFSDKTKDNCRWPLLTFRPLLFGGPRQSAGLRSAWHASTA